MGGFLVYSTVSGLLMLAMYLAYRLFLARDNQHGFNRGVLLLIYIVSFAAVPAIAFFGNLFSVSSQEIAFNGVVARAAVMPMDAKPMWGTILIWIFMAGMTAVALKTVVTWTRLISVIRSGEKIEHDGYTLVITENERFAPFSWMRYIVISRADYENNCRAIAAHELKHVCCRHWIDLLIAQAVCIVNWFNPAAWLMRDELMLVHEYQADMAVIESGHDAREYQMLLIKKAVGARFPSLANSLNHSKLKKRITMMYKEKSSAGSRLKALALVPMFALALGLSGVPAVRAAATAISSSPVSIDKGSENPSQDKTSIRYFLVTSIDNFDNKTHVYIKGEGLGNSLTVSGGTFTTKGKTYQVSSLKCSMTGGVAEITATFPFISEFDKSSMTLIVNGDEIPFNLENFFDRARTGSLAGEPDAVSAPTFDLSKGSLGNGTTIYLDGAEISEEEMKALSPENIASITVDKRNIIIIESKK